MKVCNKMPRAWTMMKSSLSVLFIGLLVMFCPAEVSSQSVDQYLNEIEQGQYDRARADLPRLLRDYPDDPGVQYLQGVLTTDGEEAYRIFREIADKSRYNQYKDDAILKVGEYLYTRGLYISAERYLRQIPVHYPRSPHIERASNLLIRSMAAAGKMDSSRTWARVLQRQYPDIDFSFQLDGVQSSPEQSPVPETSAPPEPVDLTRENPYYDPDEAEGETDTSREEQESTGYAVQVGAFSSLENAESGKEVFEEHDYPVQIRKRKRNNVELYLVWIGQYDTREEAERVGNEIKQKLALPYFILETGGDE